jgi:hypothetical protein
MNTPTPPTRPGSWRVLVALSATLALALSACSSSAPPKWPTAGEARDALSKQFNYHFVPYQDRYRAANASLQFQITTPQDPSATNEMMVGIYYGQWTSYAKDIDNVFSVIAPDARDWAHEEEAKLASNANLNDTYDASGGSITCVWNSSVPSLLFIFTGY